MADEQAPEMAAENGVPSTQAPIAAPEPVVNVIDPDTMEVGSIPASQLAQATQLGYTQATPEQVHEHFVQSEHGSGLETVKAGLEGAAQGIAGPVAPLVEKAFGVPGENISARAEANPVVHGVTELGGLAASMMTGVGEGALASKVASVVPEGVSTLAKIGSGAARAAIENMVVASSDEASRFAIGDPTSIETAVTDIGLSGLLGGAIGGATSSVSPLWKATFGSRTSGLLKAITDKLGGKDGVIPTPMQDAIEQTGMDIAPEIKASLSNNPEVQHAFQTLQESSTGSGLKAQEALKKFKADASDTLVRSLGRTPEEVMALGDKSDYEAGADLKKSLISELKSKIDPISEQFDKIKERFSTTELSDVKKAEIADNIAQLAQKEGYHLSPSAPQAKIVDRVLSELPNLKTLEDLRKYTSVIGDNTTNPELWRVGSQIKKVLRSTEESVLDSAIGEKAPELIASHAEARNAYRQAMSTVDNLNDRLHVGRYNGPGSFIKALGDMSPEDVLRRMSPKGDAGIIGELSAKFPGSAERIKNYHLDQALKNAANRASPGEAINSKALFTALEKMSPEMRTFLLPAGAAEKVSSIQKLIEALPAKMNNSGTAKTLDSLLSKMPASATGAAALILGHNPASGYILGAITKAMGRDVPDAARLAMLKFLGSNAHIDAEGFKAMVDMMHSTLKGENLVGKSTKALFKAGQEVLPQSMLPNQRDREKLDKQIKALQTQPEQLQGVGGKTAHYLPDHGQLLGNMSAQAVAYINSQRPNETRNNPLDAKPVPNAMQKASYDRVLNIAQQPLVVIKSIKDGNLTSKDVASLNAMYPNLYHRLVSKITDQMTDIIDKGETIPYKTRLGMSLFLGQPLDSTMTPQAILAAQPKPPQSQPQTATQASSEPKHSMTALDKLPGMYQTSSQKRQAKEQA